MLNKEVVSVTVLAVLVVFQVAVIISVLMQNI
jgi:hypothetical protein